MFDSSCIGAWLWTEAAESSTPRPHAAPYIPPSSTPRFSAPANESESCSSSNTYSPPPSNAIRPAHTGRPRTPEHSIPSGITSWRRAFYCTARHRRLHRCRRNPVSPRMPRRNTTHSGSSSSRRVALRCSNRRYGALELKLCLCFFTGPALLTDAAPLPAGPDARTVRAPHVPILFTTRLAAMSQQQTPESQHAFPAICAVTHSDVLARGAYQFHW